jgi:hypothetical protein
MGGGIKVGRNIGSSWEFPYPDKPILTWCFMGGGIKVGKEHWELMKVPYPDKPVLTWRFSREIHIPCTVLSLDP